MLLRRLPPLVAAAVLCTSLHGESNAVAGRDDEPLQLPSVRADAGFSLRDFPLPNKADLQAADFSTSDPFIKVQFPGAAVHDGVATGRATVGVMLDAAGVAKDFLLIRCTKTYFGEALLAEAHRRTFAARRLQGTAVPAPFLFTFSFQPPPGMTGISNFEAASRRTEEIQGGAQFVYQPHREADLDGGQLTPTRIAIPVRPASHKGTKPLRVLVTFYVDELGRVRLPSVESVLPPELVPHAIAALQQWAFAPPKIKGEPVLVYAVRALTFRDDEPAPPRRP